MEVFLISFVSLLIFAITIITFSESISKKINPSVKLCCTIAMLGMIIASSLLTFDLIKNYRGVPVYISSLGQWAAPDNRVIIKGQFIDQSTEKIFLMINKYDQHKDDPVYVWTDFSEELQEALAQGMEDFEGQPFSIEVSDTKEGEGEGEEGDGEKDGGENSKDGNEGMSNMSEAYKIGPMPPPLLPSKLKAEDEE